MREIVMIDRGKWTAKIEYDWPENYYRETDPDRRRELLEERLSQESEEAEENRLRLLLWEHRYLNKSGRQDGVDYYLKVWNELIPASENVNAVLGKKSARQTVEEFRRVFQTETLLAHPDYEHLWYDEYVNFCRFYIEISKTDKSYTNILFKLARISEEQVSVKLAEDLCERTLIIPEKLGLIDEFRLLKLAAEDSFTGCFPEKQYLYERSKRKIAGDRSND